MNTSRTKKTDLDGLCTWRHRCATTRENLQETPDTQASFALMHNSTRPAGKARGDVAGASAHACSKEDWHASAKPQHNARASVRLLRHLEGLSSGTVVVGVAPSHEQSDRRVQAPNIYR